VFPILYLFLKKKVLQVFNLKAGFIGKVLVVKIAEGSSTVVNFEFVNAVIQKL